MDDWSNLRVNPWRVQKLQWDGSEIWWCWCGWMKVVDLDAVAFVLVSLVWWIPIYWLPLWTPSGGEISRTISYAGVSMFVVLQPSCTGWKYLTRWKRWKVVRLHVRPLALISLVVLSFGTSEQCWVFSCVFLFSYGKFLWSPINIFLTKIGVLSKWCPKTPDFRGPGEMRQKGASDDGKTSKIIPLRCKNTNENMMWNAPIRPPMFFMRAMQLKVRRWST